MKKLGLAMLTVTALLFPGCNSDSPVPNPVEPIQPAVVDGVVRPTGLINDSKKKYGRMYWKAKAMYKAIAEGTIPKQFDSRNAGCEMPVKDQGQCGQCWVYGTVGAAEINYCMQTGDKTPATKPWATQPITSCETKYYGCDGGLFSGEFGTKYGFMLESEWPNTSKNTGNTGRCDKQKLTNTKPFAKPESFVYLGSFDSGVTADELRAAIYQNGAVAVSFQADNALNAIHTESDVVTGKGSQANHEVTANAYRENNEFGNRNSWGPQAQAKGYFWIKFGAKQYTNDAGYFVFKGGPCNPPTAKLPAEYVVHSGDEVALAVKPEQGVSYEWREGKDKVVGTENLVGVVPAAGETEYRLKVSNKCGVAEIVTLVTVK
jgi:hypothetical protein